MQRRLMFLVLPLCLLATFSCDPSMYSLPGPGGTPGSAGPGALAPAEIVAGLKAALEQSVRTSITNLGQPDGYLANRLVRIAMPAELREAETLLRQVGQGQIADNFIVSMNRAAEEAVPETTDIFLSAITSMTIEEGRRILFGPDTAATEFFRRRTAPQLAARITPIVSRATDRVGVTRSYKSLARQAQMLSPFMEVGRLDLDDYVTNEALDGLFLMMGQEERKIRENPAARTSELLRRVFGAQD